MILLERIGRGARLLFLKAAIPTPGQVAAGNYKKGHTRWRGLDITIENPTGSVRRGTHKDGTPWEVTMLNDYGYIRRTLGTDGGQVDCFMGPNPEAQHVYIIHQRKHQQWYTYDEDKCCIGFASKRDALVCYLSHYDDPRFLGEVSVLPADEFKRRVLETPGKTRYERKLAAS